MTAQNGKVVPYHILLICSSLSRSFLVWLSSFLLNQIFRIPNGYHTVPYSTLHLLEVVFICTFLHSFGLYPRATTVYIEKVLFTVNTKFRSMFSVSASVALNFSRRTPHKEELQFTIHFLILGFLYLVVVDGTTTLTWCGTVPIFIHCQSFVKPYHKHNPLATTHNTFIYMEMETTNEQEDQGKKKKCNDGKTHFKCCVAHVSRLVKLSSTASFLVIFVLQHLDLFFVRFCNT